MDEDIAIINNNSRNEKIKNFLINNKKLLISFLMILILSLIAYFTINDYQEKKRIKISDQYNEIISKYSKKNKEISKNLLIEIIYKKD